jgi:hypothetical protein
MPVPFKGNKTPTIDASIGLVMRLNNLWIRADDAHLSGNLEHWNYVLDAIYDNLSHNTEVDIKKDEQGHITDIKFNSDSERIYNFFNSKIAEAKQQRQESIVKKDRAAYVKSKNDIFFRIRDKDKWLRTFMHKQGLYLKEVEAHLANAMFGGK